MGITTHFLLHGIHHYLPMDKLRLVMPPTLFVALATPFYKLAHTVFYWDWYVATAVFCGGIFGYICYDLTHYFLHHKKCVHLHLHLHSLADRFPGSPPFTLTSRNTTWNTIIKILKTDSESPVASGTACLGLSLHLPGCTRWIDTELLSRLPCILGGVGVGFGRAVRSILVF